VRTAPTSSTVTRRISQRHEPSAVGPNMSVSEPSAEMIETPRTATPEVTSSTRLLNRSTTGLGRLLRGTDQAMFWAFCSACPSPSAP
jgi:hypothetical protein